MLRTILCMPWQRQPKPTPQWSTDTAITENYYQALISMLISSPVYKKLLC